MAITTEWYVWEFTEILTHNKRTWIYIFLQKLIFDTYNKTGNALAQICATGTSIIIEELGQSLLALLTTEKKADS